MTTVTIITGSTLGSAEYVAEHVAEIMENDGITCQIFHGPAFDELPTTGIWLVVSSTHGAGDLPENIQPLFNTLNEEKPDLSGIAFGAIGIGSSEYDTFCQAIRTLDHKLSDLGAKRIGDRLEIDIQKYDIPEDPAEIWMNDWKNLI